MASASCIGCGFDQDSDACQSYHDRVAEVENDLWTRLKVQGPHRANPASDAVRNVRANNRAEADRRARRESRLADRRHGRNAMRDAMRSAGLIA